MMEDNNDQPRLIVTLTFEDGDQAEDVARATFVALDSESREKLAQLIVTTLQLVGEHTSRTAPEYVSTDLPFVPGEEIIH
jgi:hypothetical protein